MQSIIVRYMLPGPSKHDVSDRCICDTKPTTDFGRAKASTPRSTDKRNVGLAQLRHRLARSDLATALCNAILHVDDMRGGAQVQRVDTRRAITKMHHIVVSRDIAMMQTIAHPMRVLLPKSGSAEPRIACCVATTLPQPTCVRIFRDGDEAPEAINNRHCLTPIQLGRATSVSSAAWLCSALSIPPRQR